MTGLVLWENRVSQGSKVSSVFFIAISLQFALLAETFPAIRFPPEYGVGKPPWREVGDPKPNGCETNNAIRPGRRRCVPRR
jgi:hypothetical protein